MDGVTNNKQQVCKRPMWFYPNLVSKGGGVRRRSLRLGAKKKRKKEVGGIARDCDVKERMSRGKLVVIMLLLIVSST